MHKVDPGDTLKWNMNPMEPSHERFFHELLCETFVIWIQGKPEIGIEAIKALQNMFQWLCIYDQQRQTMEANTPKANSGGTNPSNLDTPISFSIQDIQQIAEV